MNTSIPNSPLSQRALILAVAGTLVVPAGCASVGYDPADWEVFVAEPLPIEAELLRICVEGAPAYEVGAGNGRAAVTGLSPADTTVRIEILDESGTFLFMTETLPVSDAKPVVTARLLESDGTPCVPAGEYVAEGEDSRLLAVRFAEE